MPATSQMTPACGITQGPISIQGEVPTISMTICRSALGTLAVAAKALSTSSARACAGQGQRAVSEAWRVGAQPATRADSVQPGRYLPNASRPSVP